MPKHQGTPTPQVVIYARVSSKQQKKEGCSIPAQLKLLRQYTVDHSFSVIEENIAAQFAEALRAIEIDGEVFVWTVTARKASHQDAKRYHDEHVAAFQKQYQKLQDRLDQGVYRQVGW